MHRDRLFGLNRIDAGLALAAIAALWMLGHPYNGLWHDSRLYTAQALFHLHPDTYRNDLFFVFGSQDKYSVFGALYALVIASWGLAAAALAMTWLGQALWLGGAVYLLARLAPEHRIFWLALLLLCALPGGYSASYGTSALFSYGEGFVTARIYAEAATLFGIGLAFAGRWKAAALAIAGGVLLHPLMALPGALILIVYALPLRRLPLLLAAAGAALLVLLAVPATSMDSRWYELALQRAPFLVLHKWALADWAPVTLSLSVLLCAWHLAEGKLKRLFLGVMIATLICMSASLVGGSLFPRALLLQLQPWRALWLTQWLALFAYAWLVLTHWRGTAPLRVAMVLFLCAWLLLDLGESVLLAPLAALAFLACARQAKVPDVSRPIWALVLIVLVFSIGYFIVVRNYALWGFIAAAAKGDALAAERLPAMGLRLQLGFGILTVPLFVLAWRSAGNRRRAAARAIVAALICCCALPVAAQLHTRGVGLFPKKLGADIARNDSLAQFRHAIPPQAVVYWEGVDVSYAWFLLERPSYLSREQTAGSIFSKETTYEGNRRALHVQPLSMRDTLKSTTWKLERDDELKVFTSPVATQRQVADLCQDPVLGFVVLSNPVEQLAYVAKWDVASVDKQYYLYDCRSVRPHG